MAAFFYLADFGIPGEKYDTVQIDCLAICDVVYDIYFVNDDSLYI
jgi:hypothetical protein